MIKDFSHAHLIPPGYRAVVDYPTEQQKGDNDAFILRIGRLINGEQLSVDVLLVSKDATLSDLDMQQRILDTAMNTLRASIADRITWQGKPISIVPPAERVDMIAWLLDREHYLKELLNANAKLHQKVNSSVINYALFMMVGGFAMIVTSIITQWWFR